MLKKLIKRFIFKPKPYPSETSKCRPRLARYCQGFGLDIGPGGDPITNHAIRVDLELPYSSVGQHPVQLGGDASELIWFRDKIFDFVFSSHVLEDFVDTGRVLREWLRVIKGGGLLILYCPDEQRFRTHCQKTGQPYNPAHKLPHFSFDWVKTHLEKIDPTGRMIHNEPHAEIYSWELVWQRGDG